ncbi:MAG TPA: MBG domain-containing protein [Candidatus Binatia bacterium]|jgi:hypothetical protein
MLRPARTAVLLVITVAIGLVAAGPARATNNSYNCAPNGSVTLANANAPNLGSSVTAVPSHGVIEQSVSGNPFVVKNVGDPISWSGNSIVNYRNTSNAASDSFSIGGVPISITIVAGPPPTATTTSTSDVTITFSASNQAIGVSAQVSPIPPSGTVTFSIPGAGSNANAGVNAQGMASTNFVVTGGTPSGNYTITATFNGPANYASSFGTATLHINFYTTVTAPSNTSTTYNPSAHNVTLPTAVTSQFGGTVNTGKVTFTVTDSGANVVGNPVQSTTVAANATSVSYGLPAALAAGDYSITADYSGGGNLLASTGYATLTVNKASQPIAFGPFPAVTYGVAPITLSATGGPTGNPVTFSVVSGPGQIQQGTMLAVTGAATINVAADQTGDANYNAGHANALQAVNQAPLTVTADPQTRVYGASNPTFTFSATGLVNNDDAASAITGALTSAPPSAPVGMYPITPGTLNAPNYTVTYNSNTLTVTPATLTVTADSLFKVQGAANPVLTYSLSGFVNGDDQGDVSGTPALGTTAVDVSPVGDYPITIAVGTLTAANYGFSLVDGTLHVGGPPSSQVDAIDAASCAATDLTVHWSRTDGESDPVTYSVYVSENHGGYVPLVLDTTSTSAPFSGTLGNTYDFYSLEKDQAANQEQPPATPDIEYVIAPCDADAANDLALLKIAAPKTVTLSAKTPAKLVRVKVSLQNRAPHPETVPDLATLGKLVHLNVGSNGVTCTAPAAIMLPGKPQKKLPLILKSKGKLQVLFDVPLDCANDAAKGAGHDDYRLFADVSHSALGSGDAHPADDACPRTVTPPSEVDQFPNGKIKDKGCGAKLPDKTFGGPVLLDVFVKP